MAVKVDTRSGFRAENPQALFTGEQVRTRLFDENTPWQRLYDVSADGQRFVVVQQVSGSTATITVVENWFKEFKAAHPR